MNCGIFNGKQIALDLSFDVGFKKKCEIKNCITSNGGIISYIVTKKSSYVVVNDTDKIDISSKCRNAVKYGIPIVNLEFLWKSVEAGQILNVEDFVVGGKSKKQDFKSGKISSSHLCEQDSNKKKGVKIYNIKSCKVWKPDDTKIPDFDEDAFEIAKYTVFHYEDIKKNINIFCCLEIHVQSTSEDQQYRYRVFTQSLTRNDEKEVNGSEEFRFTNISDEAVYMYKYIYDSFISKKYIPLKHNIPRNIGSGKVQRLITEESVRKEDLSSDIKRLVDYIWLEATGQLEDILTIPITDIKFQQIDKVEGVLLEIKKCLADNDNNKMSSLLSEFYSILPHKREDKDGIDKRWLSNKQDLCQLIRDMISVTEATNWSIRSSSEAKYKALRCHIQHLHSNNTQFNTVKNHVLQSMDNNMKIEIQNIFEVHRPIENDNFTHKLHPKQLLFHSSRVENFVGLLSRGLLLPKVVVDDYGGKRTDAGLLGTGIYFASSASKSARYSSASNVIGSRFMLVCEVALGNIYETTKHNTELKQPPQGFNSVHGVCKAESDFYDDEYVIYYTNQQRIQYLVEFVIDGDDNKTLHVTDIDTDIQKTSLPSQFDNIAINDIKDVENPLNKVKPGLISTGSDNPVNLKSVHIKARLLDLAAQVIVLQEYFNSSTDSSIEAKYVFPLDDMAAVCGFEAFINGKHIIGEVKEKEIARKEYKEAISEGHGAYLMDRDEETPDIFTVSVGNLPPGACVLIKITYVAELQVEGEEISFRLPGSVAPWKNDAAMNDITQSELNTFNVKQQMSTMQIAVEMPFDIVKLYSPTNRVLIKKTASKAVVKLFDNEQIGDGFQLLIGLNEIHVPRMWVEKTPSDSENRACMLTFYPEFEARENEDCKIVFILDLSNSMTGNGLEDAKKLIYLTLHHLSKKSEFNILVFGTGYEELFACAVKPTESNLQIAKQFLKRLCADRGNTELYQPLHCLCLLPPTNTTRNIFLFSDGHINNDDTVLNTASLHSKHTRIFTFAVSCSANVHFLRGIARVSGGSYEYFDRKSKSKWEGKIKDQLNKACQPSLTSVGVEWQQFDDNLPEPIQAPRKITALFNGSRQVVYGFVPNCTLATLRAVVDGEEMSTVVSTPDLNITTGQILHRLTARSVIRDWEDGMLSSDKTQHEVIKKNLKDYIINISKEYSLVTQFTSFIAVEKRDEDEKDLLQGRGPQIVDLVDQEDVDILSEISWPVIEKPVLLTQDIKEIIDDGNIRPVKNASDQDGSDDAWSWPDGDSDDADDISEDEEDSSSLVYSITEGGGDVADEKCKKMVIEEEESDDEMGFGLFDDDYDESSAALCDLEVVEKKSWNTVKSMMVEEEESYDDMTVFFGGDEPDENFDETSQDKLEELEERSGSLTAVTGGGSFQLQSNQTSNITPYDVKKPHRYRPGWSYAPVKSTELVEEKSNLDHKVRKSTFTLQRARCLPGGKAPLAEGTKIATNEEDNSNDFGSIFQSQQQDKITGIAVRDSLNTALDTSPKNMKKDSDYDKPMCGFAFSSTSVTHLSSGQSFGSGAIFGGNTSFSSGTGFRSGDLFGASAPLGGRSEFDINRSFPQTNFGGGSALFGGGSSSTTGFGSSEFDSNRSFPQTNFGGGSALFRGGSSSTTGFGSSEFDSNRSFPKTNFGGGSALFGGISSSTTGFGSSEFDGNRSFPKTNFRGGSALFGGGRCSKTGIDFCNVAPPLQSQAGNQLYPSPFVAEENIQTQPPVLANVSGGFNFSPSSKKKGIKPNFDKSPTPCRSSAFIPPLAQIDCVPSQSSSPALFAVVPPPPPPPPPSGPPPPCPTPVFMSSTTPVPTGPSPSSRLPASGPRLPPPAPPILSPGFVPFGGRPRLPPPPPMLAGKSFQHAKPGARSNLVSEIQMVNKLSKKEENFSPVAQKFREMPKVSLVHKELKATESEKDTIDKPLRRSDDRVIEDIARTRFSDVRSDDLDLERSSRTRFSDVCSDDLDLERRSRTRFSDDRSNEPRLRSRLKDVQRGRVMKEWSRSTLSDASFEDSVIENDQDLLSEWKCKKKPKGALQNDRDRKVGIKAVVMYNDMVDITDNDMVDITYNNSLTPCKKLKSDDLTSYGIGVNIPCIRNIDTTLTTEACNQLITLQSKDGHWNYHSLLEIDEFKCIDLLIKSGVKSLGEKVSDDIMNLLITLIAVLSILEAIWKQLPIKQREKMIGNKNTWKSLLENFTLRSEILQTQDTALLSSVEKGIHFYKNINDKYPLVYYTLELGDDWITIVTKMLQLSLASC